MLAMLSDVRYVVQIVSARDIVVRVRIILTVSAFRLHDQPIGARFGGCTKFPFSKVKLKKQEKESCNFPFKLNQLIGNLLLLLQKM
jgi:hypothetical protein